MDLTAPTAKNYGLTDLPLHFDPPVSSPSELKLRLMKAPKDGFMDGWVFQEPAPKLPRLSGIPIAFVVSEASYHAQYDHLTSYVMNQCGVDHDLIRLEEAGIHGNGHMMMIEKNSLEIAGLLAGWMEEHIH